jgi:hypothetical protein
MVKQHILKTWLEEFKDIKSGRKPFDFRKNDRDFQLGDTVISAEYNQHSKKFTGEKHEARITYLIKGGKFGIPEGYCIMALKEINKKKVLVKIKEGYGRAGAEGIRLGDESFKVDDMWWTPVLWKDSFVPEIFDTAALEFVEIDIMQNENNIWKKALTRSIKDKEDENAL